jgi:hypothetical protein
MRTHKSRRVNMTIMMYPCPIFCIRRRNATKVCKRIIIQVVQDYDHQSSPHPPQLIALTNPLGRFFLSFVSLSSLFLCSRLFFFFSSSLALLNRTDTLSKLSLLSFFLVLPMLFMSPTKPAFSPSSSLSQSSQALVACCRPYPVVLMLALRDV